MICQNTFQEIKTSTSGIHLGTSHYCCLHLGMPKTATTSLQMCLFSKHSQLEYLGKFPRDSLGEFPTYNPLKFPFNYLRRFLGINHQFPEKAGFLVNEYLLGKAPKDRERCRLMLSELLAPAVAAGRVPLWSKENMTAGGASKKMERAKAFREILGDCKVIIFVRHPLRFIESLYFQQLKGFQMPEKSQGWARNFGKSPRFIEIEQWLDANWALPKKGAFGHLLYAETAGIYAQVFGRENVRLFVFEQLVEDSDVVIERLCQFIGIGPEEGTRLFRDKPINSRWTVAHVEKLKLIEKSFWKSFVFRYGLRTTRTKMIGLYNKLEISTGPKAKAEIPACWQRRIVELTREANQRLVAQWGLSLEKHDYPL